MPRRKSTFNGLSMSNAEILEAALIGLWHQRDEIEEKMAELRRQIGDGRDGQPARKSVAADSAEPTPKKRTMSAAGRARIVAATKKRWAAFHAKKAAPAKAAKK